METRYTAATVLFAALIASGCTSGLPLPEGGGSSDQPQQVPGKGLIVQDLRITDQTLSPEQSAVITLVLKNFHREPIDIGEITMINQQPLSKEKQGCTPEEIGKARPEVKPVMECKWEVTAPTSEEIGSFSQRKTSVAVNVPYQSRMVNYQPLKVQFKSFEDINTTKKKAMTYSNGEIKASMQTESPVALGQEKNVQFKVSKSGTGRLRGNFSFDYSPATLFSEDCPDEKKPVLENQVEFGCSVGVDSSSSSVRNLFLTIGYKYAQSPSLGVTIVKNS